MRRLLLLSATLTSLFIAAVWIEPTRQTKTLSAFEVIAVDGDTLGHGDDRYRLVGFDTPETFRAQCGAEKALGLRAKDRLTEIIQINGRVELEIKPDPDRYGRFLAIGACQRKRGWINPDFRRPCAPIRGRKTRVLVWLDERTKRRLKEEQNKTAEQ